MPPAARAAPQSSEVRRCATRGASETTPALAPPIAPLRSSQAGARALSNVNFLGWNYENPRCNFSDERNGARITKQTGRLSRAARPGRVP